MYVIVTDCEYRMSLSAVRDLADAGFRVVCATTKTLSQSIGGASKYAEDTFSADANDAEEYAGRLDSICSRFVTNGVLPVVFPVGKRTLSALSRFPLHHGRYLVAPPEILAKANDKASVLMLADMLGIPIPKCYALTPGESVNDAASRLTYPCVVKYRDGEALGLKADKRYAIVKTPDAFVSVYTAMSEKQAEPIIQRYIAGDGYGFSCIVGKEGNLIDYIMHRRIREYPISGGPSTCCEAINIPALKEASQKLLSALGFKGVAMVEFRGSPETGFYLMEINPRVWGSFALTRCAGSRFCEHYVRYCRTLPRPGIQAADVRETDLLPPGGCSPNDPQSFGTAPQGAGLYRVGAKMCYRVNDAAAGLSYWKAGKIGKAAAAFLDIANPFVRDGVIELSDIKPFTVYLKNKL